MAVAITSAGEKFIAQKQAAGQPVLLTQFVLAHIPGLDPAASVNRAEAMPDDEKIVYRYNIPNNAKGYLNPNEVMYSLLLTSDVGNFTFNWMGLCADDGTLVAVTYLPEIVKTKTAGTTQGNNLTRNVLIEFNGAKEATGINVPASTWQIDFTVRLNSIDERTRHANRDLYGRAAFHNTGFKIEKDNLGYVMRAGVANIEGIRCVQNVDERLNILNLPKKVMLDVALQQKGTDVVPIFKPIFGTHNDFIDDAKTRHYLVDVAAVNADGTIEDKRKVLDFDESIMDYIEKAASVRGTAPALTLSGGNDRGTINEGEQFELHMPPVPASQWETKCKVRALNAEKQEVSVNPTFSGTKITCTAPQVDKETELEIQLQTWTEGGLASEWSKPFVMTVHDVPINPPTITSPADNATGIGETPTITITPGSADNPDAVHDGTKITITNDPAGKDEVASYTAQGAVTSWKVPAGQIQTNKHLYIHAQTSWNGVWSPKVTIDVFTSAQFTFIEAPKILAPQEDSEVMWSGLKCILAAPVIEVGGTLKHTKTIVEVYKGETKVQTVEATSNLLAVALEELERNTAFKIRAQFDDDDRGLSAWSEMREFRTKASKHGERVDGGVLVGNIDGSSINFLDGKEGWILVAPPTTWARKQWYTTEDVDSILQNISNESRVDVQTGDENTHKLVTNHGSAAQAAYYCKKQVINVEGIPYYSLLNLNELALVLSNTELIDKAFNVASPKLSEIVHCWSSTEQIDWAAWVVYPGPNNKAWITNAHKKDGHWVIPCRRVDLNGNPM